MKKTLLAILCALLIIPAAVSCKKEKNISLKDTRWTGNFEGYTWRLSFSDADVSLDKYYLDKIDETFHSSYTKEGKTIIFGNKMKYTMEIRMNGNSATVQHLFTKGTLKGQQIDVTVETTILEATGDVGITEGLKTVPFTKVAK